MLCSAQELGLSEDASTGCSSSADAKVGTPIASALALDDVVFEVNVTPNRPDALSHLGIAREVARAHGAPREAPEPKPLSEAARRRPTKRRRCGSRTRRAACATRRGSSRA